MKSITATKLDVSLLLPVMVLIFVEVSWETSLAFDIALTETVGSLKAQIQAGTGKSIGMDDYGNEFNFLSLIYSSATSPAS